MPERVRWRNLIVGIVALLGVATAAILILFFGRVDRIHGRTMELYARASEARGVIRGTEVWLSGQKIGMVEDVTFLPPTAVADARVLIRMQVMERYRPEIRRSSTAQVRAGASLIAAPVVYLSLGSAKSSPVAAGDTLWALPQADYEDVASRLAVASEELPDILNNLRVIATALQGAQGTLGALGVEGGGPALVEARARSARLMESVTMPTGTIGNTLAARASLTERARRVLARVDSVRRLIGSDSTSLGRLRRDSTLATEIADIRNEVDVVRARLASPEGTLGRARTDSAIFRALSEAQREMTALLADAKRHPLRYIAF